MGQEVKVPLKQVENCETNAYRDWALDKIECQPLVESFEEALRLEYVCNGPACCAIPVPRTCLHASPHDVQRVGGRLTDDPRQSTKAESLQRVELMASEILCKQSISKSLQVKLWKLTVMVTFAGFIREECRPRIGNNA